MAGSGEKTEKPTPRRLSQARKQGNVAKSVDLNSAVTLGAFTLLLFTYGPVLFQYCIRLVRSYLKELLLNTEPLTQESFIHLVNTSIWHLITMIAPLLCGVMLFAILANVYQIKILFAPAVLRPNLSKLNPLGGTKRFFSQRSLIELVKGILKMVIIGSVGTAIVWSHRDELLSLSQTTFAQAWMVLFKYILEITFVNFIILLALGILDRKYQRYQWIKSLKMTKQEVKDEMKNLEGNPQVKRQIRQKGHSMLQGMMLKNVATADVVVNNPTHFSVAIQYDPDDCPAPRVVAKGADYMAFKIREIARANGVPMVENKPLARALYDNVEVNHMIPPNMFIAVAEVLAYVYRLNKGRGKRYRNWAKPGGITR